MKVRRNNSPVNECESSEVKKGASYKYDSYPEVITGRQVVYIVYCTMHLFFTSSLKTSHVDLANAGC